MKNLLFGILAITLFSFSGFAKNTAAIKTQQAEKMIKTEISSQELKSKKAIDDLCTRTITVNNEGGSYDVSVSGPCSQIDKIVAKVKMILAAA